MTLYSFFITVFAVCLGFIGGFLVSENMFQPRKASLPESDALHLNVEKIVADYIQQNPKEIIDSVTSYRETGFYEDMEQQAQPFLAELERMEGVSIIGNAQGVVKVVEFFDYQCPHCKSNFPVLERIVAEDPTVVVLPKHLPILGDGSPGDMSLHAAKMAEAARFQGKFVEFHTHLMQRDTPLSEDLVASIAVDLGLDYEKLLADSNSQEVTNTIARSMTIAQEIGVSQVGTPSYFIGGKVIVGAGDNAYARLTSLIEVAKNKLQ